MIFSSNGGSLSELELRVLYIMVSVSRGFRTREHKNSQYRVFFPGIHDETLETGLFRPTLMHSWKSSCPSLTP